MPPHSTMRPKSIILVDANDGVVEDLEDTASVLAASIKHEKEESRKRLEALQARQNVVQHKLSELKTTGE